MSARSYIDSTTTCYKEGTTYKAVRYDGVTIKQSTRAEDVIQAALNQKGVIHFAPQQPGQLTTWDCTSRINSSTAFVLPERTYLTADAYNNIFITVPQGYSGKIIKIGQNVDVTSQGIDGIGFYERGSAQGNWTGIKFEMNGTKGIQFCEFSNITMYHNKVGIEMEVSGPDAWINSNTFQNIVIFSSEEAAYLFDLTGGGDLDFNTFIHCMVETGDQYGFKDVDGEANSFHNCQVWDSGSIVDMNIKATADRTVIMGGRIGKDGTYTNLGTNTYKPVAAY